MGASSELRGPRSPRRACTARSSPQPLVPRSSFLRWKSCHLAHQLSGWEGQRGTLAWTRHWPFLHGFRKPGGVSRMCLDNRPRWFCYPCPVSPFSLPCSALWLVPWQSHGGIEGWEGVSTALAYGRLPSRRRCHGSRWTQCSPRGLQGPQEHVTSN